MSSQWTIEYLIKFLLSNQWAKLNTAKVAKDELRRHYGWQPCSITSPQWSNAIPFVRFTNRFGNFYLATFGVFVLGCIATNQCLYWSTGTSSLCHIGDNGHVRPLDLSYVFHVDLWWHTVQHIVCAVCRADWIAQFDWQMRSINYALIASVKVVHSNLNISNLSESIVQ